MGSVARGERIGDLFLQEKIHFLILFTRFGKMISNFLKTLNMGK